MYQDEPFMILIYEGKLCLYTTVDRKDEFPLAYIEKGAIINAHNFLSGQHSDISIKCLTPVTYFYLTLK